MKLFNFKAPGIMYNCQLTCKTCIATTKSRSKCKLRTCIGVPYCWIHLLAKKHLRIKDSTIKNGGKGLFAFDPKQSANAIIFRPQDTIINYVGEHLSKRSLDNRYGDYTAPYAIALSKTRVIDSACKRGVASLANTNNKNKLNASFVKDKNKVYLIATKIIKNNNEIFVDYGDEYLLDEFKVKSYTS
jgi:hypothetical protein